MPLSDQLPDQQQIGDRRQRRQQDLEQPDLRQRHHAERAVARIEGHAAVLPQALQRAVGPAETLLGQTAKELGASVQAMASNVEAHL